jgi:hypothetical protein
MPYPSVETKTIIIKWPKNIKKRSMKEWYSLKEVMELNPWILGGIIPKGRWEVVVYNK